MDLTGSLELRGRPKVAHSSPESQDPQVAAKLWREAERLTGVFFGESLAAVATPTRDTPAYTIDYVLHLFGRIPANLGNQIQ